MPRRGSTVGLIALVVMLLPAPGAGADETATGWNQSTGIYEMVFPVDGEARYVDTWGACRGRRCSREHEGTDIFADKLTPVVAVASGTVGCISDERYGNCCWLAIYHDDGWQSWYIHLNNDRRGSDDGRGKGFVRWIELGSRVEAGQRIGYVGDSGNAEGTPSHLHFELHLPDEPRSTRTPTSGPPRPRRRARTLTMMRALPPSTSRCGRRGCASSSTRAEPPQPAAARTSSERFHAIAPGGESSTRSGGCCRRTVRWSRVVVYRRHRLAAGAGRPVSVRGPRCAPRARRRRMTGESGRGGHRLRRSRLRRRHMVCRPMTRRVTARQRDTPGSPRRLPRCDARGQRSR